VSTWRAKVSELFRQRQIARDRRKQARQVIRDQREAEELERARQGAGRFPPGGF
jgi:hypothetical protein